MSGEMLKQTADPFVPKRGRPSKKQAEAINRAILDAGTRLFLEAGSFDAVSMETVAFVAGVSKGTLYARYPVKEDLFTAVARDRINTWIANSPADPAFHSGNAATRLRAHARSLALWMANQEVRALQRVFLSVGDRFPVISQTLLEHGFLHGIDRIAEDLATVPGKSYGDPRTVAACLTSAIVGWQSQRWHVETPTKELIAFADRVVDLLVSGQDGW